MAQIKVLKFVSGVPREINPALDDIVAKTFVVGGTSGTILTKAILDTLSQGTGDASTLHNHDTLYWRKSEFISSTAGAADANKPIKTDGQGKIDPSFIDQANVSHSNLSGLGSDDHPQYHDDARGDARYYQKTEFVDASAGIADAGKPVALDANGKIGNSLIDSASVNHNDTTGIQGGGPAEAYHLTNAEHTALAGGTNDASSLHNHDTQYYTKAQVDATVGTKANAADVIYKDGSEAFTANQSLGGNKLTNLADAIDPSDAVAYQQLTGGLGLKVNKAGDTMSGNLDMDGNTVTGLAMPVSGTDAANKNYVDNKITNTSWREPVRVMDNSSTTLPTGTAVTIDDVVLANGDEVLFTNLSSSNNRVFILSGVGASLVWTTRADGPGAGIATDGDAIFVKEGTDRADTQWNYNGAAFVQFSGAGQIQAGVGLLKTGNTLDVNLGAGIMELPSDEVGLDLHANGALELIDPSSELPSSANDAQLAVRVDNSTIERGAGGILVKDAGISEQKMADNSVSRRTIVDDAVGSAELESHASVDANRAVTSNHIKDSAVITRTIADDSVTKEKIAADVAGNGLGQNVNGALEVKVDDATIEIATDALQVKDAGIDTQHLAPQAVDSTKIDFGITGDQVSAADIPLEDTDSKFTASDLEAALAELANVTYVESLTAGETIGTGDLVVMTRDNGDAPRALRASAAASDNYVNSTITLDDLTYTSVAPEKSNSIRIRHVNNGPGASLTITVSGRDITVNLATDGGGAITSTATQIAAAITASAPASALITAAVTGTGSNIQTTYPYMKLAGGQEYNDNGRWEVYGMALEAGISGNSFRALKFGRLPCQFVSAPTAAMIGKAVYLSANKGKAVVEDAPSAANDGIVFLGRLVSTTEVDFRGPVLRGING